MRFIYIFIIALIVLILSGCQGGFGALFATQTPTSTSTSIPTMTLTSSPTLIPTRTQTPTPTPTPTQTPTPTLLVLVDTPLPPSLEPITALNGGQVSALAKWQVSAVNDLAWSPEGNILAVATRDHIEFFDVITRDSIRSLYPETAGLQKIAFCPPAAGSWLVAGTRRGSEQEGYGSAVELWIGPDWKPLGVITGSPTGLSDLAFTAGGQYLGVAYASSVEANNMIEFIDSTYWTISSTLKTGPILNLAFSPDGRLLATSPDRYAINTWDIRSKTLAYKFYTSFTGAVNTMAFSTDGRFLVSGHYDGAIRIWDMANGLLLNTFQQESVVESIAFSPDAKLLATGAGFEDNLVRIYSLETNELLNVLEGHSQAVTDLLFSPDSKLLVSSTYDGEIRSWGIRP